MSNSPESDHENTGGSRSINAGGDMIGGIQNTGDGNTFNIYGSPQDIWADMWATFEDYTRRALRNSRPLIQELPDPIERTEIVDVENALGAGQSVIILGPSGTGKSGLGYELVESRRGQFRLLVDCRAFHEIRSPTDLQNRLSLGNLSLQRACIGIMRHCGSANGPFRIVFDQIDSVAGTLAGEEFVQVALDCHGRSDIQVVVISRSGEVQEQRLLAPLYREQFHVVESARLPDAVPYLNVLGIVSPSAEAVEMARNLLNLSLMATIRLKNPSFDFGNLTSEVALWTERLEVFLQQNQVTGPQWLAELTRLAGHALKEPSSTFRVDDPPEESHRHLLSEEFIKRSTETSQVCAFSHENLQDFLYARSAVRTGRSVEEVLAELGPFRGQGVLVWMDKIAQAEAPHSSSREVLLRSMFHV